MIFSPPFHAYAVLLYLSPFSYAQKALVLPGRYRNSIHRQYIHWHRAPHINHNPLLNRQTLSDMVQVLLGRHSHTLHIEYTEILHIRYLEVQECPTYFLLHKKCSSFPFQSDATQGPVIGPPAIIRFFFLLSHRRQDLKAPLLKFQQEQDNFPDFFHRSCHCYNPSCQWHTGKRHICCCLCSSYIRNDYSHVCWKSTHRYLSVQYSLYQLSLSSLRILRRKDF